MKRNTLCRASQQQEDSANIYVLAGSYQAALGLKEQNRAAEKNKCEKKKQLVSVR